VFLNLAMDKKDKYIQQKAVKILSALCATGMDSFAASHDPLRSLLFCDVPHEFAPLRSFPLFLNLHVYRPAHARTYAAAA
jgi:hypothetical protein